ARAPGTGPEVTELDLSERRAAATLLVLARIVYAFSWYNIGAVLPLVGKGLDANTEQLGIVLGAFLVGAGVFQVPAGFWAMRRGYRSTSIFALALMGTFCFASAFSPDWVVLALLRFGAGSRGPVIGIYNSGFAIGSATGLLGGALIGAFAGWQWALAVGGLGLLALCVGAAFLLPPLHLTGIPENWKAAWKAGKPILSSRNLWALALGLCGAWAAFYIAAQYFVQYAKSVHPAWPIALAAGLPTAMILTEVLGGPIGGWFAERRAD